MTPSDTQSCRRDSWTLAPSATPRRIPPVANRLFRERMERPVKALPMLQPPATAPPNPMSNPPKNRRGSSGASGTCQWAVPFDHALSQLPRSTPSTINAPQVIGWVAWSTSTPRRVRLGPVIDNPQCHPAGAPTTQARVPSAPSIMPVWYQGQLSGAGAGFGKSRSKNPTRTTTPAITQAGPRPNKVGIDAAPESDITGRDNNIARKRKNPSAVSNPPTAKPNTAMPAPRLPVPTRDQMEVAQPLAHIMPKPNISPPTVAASQVNGGTGKMRS